MSLDSSLKQLWSALWTGFYCASHVTHTKIITIKISPWTIFTIFLPLIRWPQWTRVGQSIFFPMFFMQRAQLLPEVIHRPGWISFNLINWSRDSWNTWGNCPLIVAKKSVSSISYKRAVTGGPWGQCKPFCFLPARRRPLAKQPGYRLTKQTVFIIPDAYYCRCRRLKYQDKGSRFGSR